MMQSNEIKQWNFLVHLSQLSGFIIPLGNIIIPLVLWQMKKDQDQSIDQHGKEVVNWQISLLIYSIISFILSFVIVGFFLFIILALLYVVFAVIGAIKANNGELWKYPGTIRLLK